MNDKFVHSGNGKKFEPTEKGKEVGRIAAKYADGIVHHYDHCVPASWVENGWVEQVEIRK